jgi:hypothetical protein
VEYVLPAQDMDMCGGSGEQCVMKLWAPQSAKNFMTKWETVMFLRWDVLHKVKVS